MSFKTNVNRSKTKKWVEAKKNAYDGDDWGDYDEYDEYGASEPDPYASAAPQAHGYGQPGRSFTDPQRQAQPQSGRRYVTAKAQQKAALLNRLQEFIRSWRRTASFLRLYRTTAAAARTGPVRTSGLATNERCSVRLQ